MNKFRFALGLIGTLLCAHANALQMGQLTTASRLGEPLSARIELFGMAADAGSSPEVSIKPEIGSPYGSREQAAVADLVAVIAHYADGVPYIALRSTNPIDEPLVRFRVRVATPGETRIAHFTITLSPPVAQAAPRRRIQQNREVTTLPVSSGQSYGPVQPGQSLWQILRQLGHASADATALIEQIVATNPRAFIDGDANRLRVGAMLRMPGTGQPTASLAAPAAPSVAVTDTPSLQGAAAPDVAIDAGLIEEPAARSTAMPLGEVAAGGSPAALPDDVAATEARLAALTIKFAAIRARHAEQTSEPVTLPEAAPTTAPAASPAPTETAPVPAAAGPVVAARQTPVQPAAMAATPMLGQIVFTVGLGALFLLVVVLAIVGYRRLQRRHAEAGVSHADAHLVAEIGRKAEKRLQLEDELKRMRTAKFAPAPQPARELARADADDSLLEIENRIAHGQYADAETMLIEIIRTAPHNFRAKVRLAEIFYLNERAEEFVELAGDLYMNHRSDIGDDGWQRLVRMGKVIAPDRPPFSGPIQVAREA